MPQFISDNDTLKRYIPNAFREAEGEKPYFDKILPWIETAENWIIENIIGRACLPALLADNFLRRTATDIVAHMAFRDAVPSLDLVLTPNGFGIVNTGTVAPASPLRINALRSSLLIQRDTLINDLLRSLIGIDEWRATDRGRFYTASLFTNPTTVTISTTFDDFMEFREKAIPIEDHLAEEAVSPELIQTLRSTKPSELTPAQRSLIGYIRDFVRRAIDASPYLDRKMRFIVQYIRANPVDFPQWEETETAKLYSPAVFENNKNANGYWF